MIGGRWLPVLTAVLLAGCAGAVPVRIEPTQGYVPEPAPAPNVEAHDTFRGIPDKYRKLADSVEHGGDLRRALLYRKVVNGFAPEDTDAREHVERLERKIRRQVDRHYRDAVALEGSGETEKARREFLAVLFLDPGHEGAFRRVKQWKNGKNGKNGGAGPDFRSWTVREGDTLRKIAGEAYRDPDKEFLVAYFNHLPAGSPVPIGTVLILPDVDTGMTKTPEKIPGYSNPEKEGSEIRHVVERKEAAERTLREAEAHYASGMQYFIAEDLEGAIREWGKTLSLDPSHAKARKDIEKARRLKGKIETPK